MSRVLGIDQSYASTGCVIIEDGECIHAQIISSDTDLDKIDRAWQIAHDILTMIAFHGGKLDGVALEGLAFGMRGSATRDLAGLQFIIIAVLRHSGVIENNIQVISPLSVKKFATGSGKADKKQMIEVLPKNVRERFDNLGVKKTTGLADLADAYHIAQYAHDQHMQKKTKNNKCL
jgi:Holliday junction resolvasome RuvABC endonuclease subunit